MEQEFTHGTLAIDKEGVVTDTLFCDDGRVQVTVVIPHGVLGDYSSFDHERIWSIYQAMQKRIEAVVKDKCAGFPTQSCTITVEKSDLLAHY